MSSALEIAFFLILVVTLCVVSAAAGMLWWRSRTLPIFEVAQLARDLAERLRTLESLIARFDSPKLRRPTRSAHNLRLDRGGKGAHPEGPTLINVPDLAVQPGKNAEVSAEMARRFGPIWKLADAGQSAEEIARASGQPIGQVELILGLRHPKG